MDKEPLQIAPNDMHQGTYNFRNIKTITRIKRRPRFQGIVINLEFKAGTENSSVIKSQHGVESSEGQRRIVPYYGSERDNHISTN